VKNGKFVGKKVFLLKLKVGGVCEKLKSCEKKCVDWENVDLSQITKCQKFSFCFSLSASNTQQIRGKLQFE
jgi:hypothetical protein